MSPEEREADAKALLERLLNPPTIDDPEYEEVDDEAEEAEERVGSSKGLRGRRRYVQAAVKPPPGLLGSPQARCSEFSDWLAYAKPQHCLHSNISRTR